jgi:hypothetical protein
MTSQYIFHNHEGREIAACLVGAPGRRAVAFTLYGANYGSVALKSLLNGEWRSMLAPSGDVEGCAEADLVLIDTQAEARLKAWAQAGALGRDGGDEE